MMQRYRYPVARTLLVRCCALLLVSLGALLPASAQAATPFAQRLEAVDAAVAQHLQQQGGAEVFPADLRRIAWLPLRNAALADALVVLKPRRDECAAAARTPRPCRALVLLAGEGGRYAVATELTLRVQPLVLTLARGGGIDELFHSRDGGEAAQFNGYRLADGAFAPSSGPVGWDSLAQAASVVVDDRNLPLLADQRYAARQFDNAGARLAPFRIHFDGIQVSRRGALHDAAFEGRAGALVEGLAGDLARVVGRLPWPQTLEARIWSCEDWMVPRRFWEVESRRLGRIGLCADPLVFAQRVGLVRSPAETLAVARYRLLQEIGVAFVLRIAPLSQRSREQLKSPDAVHQLRRLGHTAGLHIGHALGLQTPDQAHAAHALWQQISAQWFERIEMGARHFVIHSPELRAFDAELQLTGQVLQCVFPAGAATPPPHCTAPVKADIEAVGGFVRRALTP